MGMDYIIAGICIIAFITVASYALKSSQQRIAEYRRCHTKYDNDISIFDIETGLTLLAGSERYLTFKEIITTYKAIQTCTNLTATKGPDVQYASFSEMGIGESWGTYMSVARRIMINTDLERDCVRDQQIIKHEFVHFLLTVNGYAEESRLHASNYFIDCGPGIDTHNGK